MIYGGVNNTIPCRQTVFKKKLVTNIKMGYYMAKQRNRVNLTLDDELYATLTELSELSGTPRAAIINELLTEVKPHLDLSIELIKKLKANQMKMTDARMIFNNLVADAGDVINQAQGDINRALREINKPDEESDDNVTDNGKSD